MVDMTETVTDEESPSQCKLPLEYNLIVARLEEERNIPVLLLVRNVFFVKIL